MTDIPRPPVVPLVGEFPPIIEPALRDMPEIARIEVSEPIPVDVEEGDERAREERAMLARRVALADARVLELLEGRHYTVVGVSERDDKESRRPSLVVVVFSYDDSCTYEVTLDDADVPVVRDIARVVGQAAPSEEEIETAIQLARGHRSVAEHLDPDFDAHVLLTGDVEPGDEHYRRRAVSVVFGYPDDRLPRVHAVMDLGSEELIWMHCRTGEQR